MPAKKKAVKPPKKKPKRARAAPAAEPDGRRLRAARSHTAIIDAVYELVRETGEPPDIEAVAERAGVGVRTVFRQFSDLETLHRSVNERLDQEVRALLEQPTGDVSPLDASIARRALIYEHIAPFRRAARLARPTSRFIVEQELLIAALFRAALEELVAGDVDDDVFEALDLLLSWEAWERLRRTQGLGILQAQNILSAAASSLIATARTVHVRAEAPEAK